MTSAVTTLEHVHVGPRDCSASPAPRFLRANSRITVLERASSPLKRVYGPAQGEASTWPIAAPSPQAPFDAVDHALRSATLALLEELKLNGIRHPDRVTATVDHTVALHFFSAERVGASATPRRRVRVLLEPNLPPLLSFVDEEANHADHREGLDVEASDRELLRQFLERLR